MNGRKTVRRVLAILLVLQIGLVPQRAAASTVTFTSSSLPASSSEAPASSSAFLTMSESEGDSTSQTSEVTSPTYDPSEDTNLTTTEATDSMFTSDNLTYSFDNQTWENATTDDLDNGTWSDSTAEASTTTTATTTSYIIYCGGSTVIPAGTNTITHIISYAAVQFSCLEGFRESGTGNKLQTCQKGVWKPQGPLVCEALNPTAAPTLTPSTLASPESVVPKWLPVLAVFLFLVVAAAVVILLVLALYLYRRRYVARSTTVIRPLQQMVQSPPLEEKPRTSTPKEPETKQEAQPRRWWPWSGPPKKPPPRQFCLDGVALFRNEDHSLLPVRRRF